MTRSQMKKKALVWNSVLWLTAMVLPGALSIALASTRFPWPVLLPFLLLGPMLLSNKLLAQAVGETGGETATPSLP